MCPKDRVGAYQSLEVICVIDRNEFPGILCQDAGILCQDDARWDRMTDVEAFFSRGNTRLLDLSTGSNVHARTSDLPRKNNLLTLH